MKLDIRERVHVPWREEIVVGHPSRLRRALLAIKYHPRIMHVWWLIDDARSAVRDFLGEEEEDE